MKMKKAQIAFPVFSLLATLLISIIILFIAFKMSSVGTRVLSATDDSRHLMNLRRMISSADCLAYDTQSIKIIESYGQAIQLVGYRVFPNIIDSGKVADFNHVNCMRLDFSEVLEGDDEFTLYNNQEMFIYDIDTDEFLLDSTYAGYNPISTSHPTLPGERDECTLKNFDPTAPNYCTNAQFTLLTPISIIRDGDKHMGVILFRDCDIGKFAYYGRIQADLSGDWGCKRDD